MNTVLSSKKKCILIARSTPRRATDHRRAVYNLLLLLLSVITFNFFDFRN